MIEENDGYGEGVSEQLDEIEKDPDRRLLWEAIVDAVNLVFDEPHSARANEILMRTSFGDDVRGIPLRVPSEDANYSVLWGFDETGEPVIVYVGPWPPLS